MLQNTPAVSGEERVMKPLQRWRVLGDAGEGSVGEFGQDTGVIPLLFTRSDIKVPMGLSASATSACSYL